MKDNTNTTTNTPLSSRSTLIRVTTEDFIKRHGGKVPTDPVDLDLYRSELVEANADCIHINNNLRPSKEDKLAPVKDVEEQMVVQIITAMNIVAVIPTADPTKTVPIFFHDSGKWKGTWRMEPDMKDGQEAARIMKMILSIAPGFTSNIVRSTMTKIIMNAPLVHPTEDSRLVAVNNGIYNRADKTFTKWEDADPALVFTNKILVDYHPNVQPVYITNPDGTKWDLDGWIDDLMSYPVTVGNEDSDAATVMKTDNDKVRTIWEVFADCCMPMSFMPRDRKIIIFQDASKGSGGKNGKGTLAQFIRNLVGEDNDAGLSITDWAEDFKAAVIPFCSVSVSDENPVDQIVDDVTRIKAAVTHDVISINSKHVKPFKYQPWIVPVLCCNSTIKTKDTTESWRDRLLYITFCHQYTGTDNNPLIKREYINDPRVLEYALSKILDQFGDVSQFTEAPYMKESQNAYASKTTPVFQCLDELVPQSVWGFLPYDLLYDVFREWYFDNYNTQTRLSSDSFNDLVDGWTKMHDDEWRTCYEFRNGTAYRAGKYPNWKKYHFDQYEPLANMYGREKTDKFSLKWWGNRQTKLRRDCGITLDETDANGDKIIVPRGLVNSDFKLKRLRGIERVS